MALVLIIAEHDGANLNSSTARTLACATQISDQVEVAVFAADPTAVAHEASQLPGVSRVVTITGEHNGTAQAAVLAPQIKAMAADYTHLLGPSTTFGKDLMPRVAALLGVAQISDIMAVQSAYVFERPIYAGNAIVTVEAPQSMPLVGTVRTASYRAAAADGSTAPIESWDPDIELPSHTRLVSLEASSGDRPDLQSAKFVVAGGRALASTEKFELIFRLADQIGAGVGASRAAVDAGYVANDLQVGQTGKIIAPDLYIAIGISGAIQHLTGIKDAGTIVAINKDPDAPIFEVADIGLVADLFEAIPELQAALEKA
jgi:electron transfer flavoprotein alpha subunit